MQAQHQRSIHLLDEMQKHRLNACTLYMADWHVGSGRAVDQKAERHNLKYSFGALPTKLFTGDHSLQIVFLYSSVFVKPFPDMEYPVESSEYECPQIHDENAPSCSFQMLTGVLEIPFSS